MDNQNEILQQKLSNAEKELYENHLTIEYQGNLITTYQLKIKGQETLIEHLEKQVKYLNESLYSRKIRDEIKEDLKEEKD